MGTRMKHQRRLSLSLSQLKPHYDVVVIGSGYGGSITASRLARAGKSVCLLERGRELVPGEYPDTEKAAAKETQVDLKFERLGKRTALFDFRQNEDMNVLVGCGLGGTSLINANVSLSAENAVFDRASWPEELRGPNGPIALKPYYKRAQEMLKPIAYPEGRPGYPKLLKLEANRTAGQALGEDVHLTPINVNFTTFENGRNHVGVEQQPCSNCGDCCSGCNFGAKNTVLMNYLPDAYNHGAEIFTETSVHSVKKLSPQSRGWLVYFSPLAYGRERFSSPPMHVTAEVVVLSAGTLGSTEILMRSAKQGLTVSTKLGEQFTGNGDVLAFSYNGASPINGVGIGPKDPDRDRPAGPCITSAIDARHKHPLDDGMIIEEGVIPGALDDLLPVALKGAEMIAGDQPRASFRETLSRLWRKIKGLLASVIGRGAYTGAVHHTQTMLVMGHDGSDGTLSLVNDKIRVLWPGVGDREAIKKINQRLSAVAKSLKGSFVRNPVWGGLPFMGRDLVTVHPLGGCSMGDDAASGVVDHRGRVFTGEGTNVHSGLHVADGAIIPCSLGVNPLLTISALAERNAELLASERHWVIDDTPNRPDTPPGIEHEPGIAFTESMSGHVSTDINPKDDDDDLQTYRLAEKKGQAQGTSFRFILTVDGNELNTFIDDPQHESGLFGTVSCSTLSPFPLTATEGRFNLFVADPDRVETREMRYAMTLTAESGEQYFLTGFKRIHDDRGLDVWKDTTTLYVTICQGRDSNRLVCARGILHIPVSDFVRQLRTMTVKHADDKGESIKMLARFNAFFAGSLFDSFAKGLGQDYLADPDTIRERRPLRVEAPQVYSVPTADGVPIRLTRYQGGTKGPVLLSHGLGVSSLIFSIDTIETNLLEFLYEAGYDVWLLDYRVSIELNASHDAFNADQVAKYDYPAAIDKVREVSGQDSVQVVAHCYGATTFTMALLNGLEGIRSVVISQVSTDVECGILTDIKAGLHVPDVLKILGIDSLTAYVDKDRKWLDKIYDAAMKFYPIEREERARSPVHRRITFLYGTLYELDQLNDPSFKALHEMFGVANIAALDHLTVMVRAKKIVNADGEDVYLGNLGKWKIPTRFIHGAENACFKPVGTERTMKRLQEANGPDYYSRIVIPNYGHIDCIFGKNAARDVYPHILEHLEETANS